MVRLITLLFILGVLYLYTIKEEVSNLPTALPQPSIITVEELPPIREENK